MAGKRREKKAGAAPGAAGMSAAPARGSACAPGGWKNCPPPPNHAHCPPCVASDNRRVWSRQRPRGLYVRARVHVTSNQRRDESPFALLAACCAQRARKRSRVAAIRVRGRTTIAIHTRENAS